MISLFKTTVVNEGYIQVGLAYFIGYRKNLIVPNVSYGWMNYEADLLTVSQSGWLTEIEIKISLQDLKHDLKKGHGHNDKRVRKLVYCIPEACLEWAVQNLPAGDGIIIWKVKAAKQGNQEINILSFSNFRQAKARKDVKQLTDKEIISLQRLGCMRIWSLKLHNLYSKQYGNRKTIPA